MASSARTSAVAFYLLCLAYASTAANYPLSSAGTKLLNVMSNLQYMDSPQLLLPIYGSSHAAALCERLGVYLLRPPTGPASKLDDKIAAWLPGGAAKSLGWKLIAGKQADAGKAGQKLANAGTIVLAVVEGKCYGGSSVIGTVVPEATDDASLASEGPRVIVGINRGKASRLLGSCFSKGGVKYYSYTRPAAAQLPNTYSGVWTNGLTEYLVEAAPGGGIQAATIYYADSTWLSYYKYADFGATSPSSSATPTWYSPRWPKKNPTQFGDTGGPTGPYTFKADGSATFKLSAGKITYTASGKTAALKRKAGSGTCAACGFWYSNNSKLAFAFYVESAGTSGLTGRLLSAAYSRLLSKDSLIGSTKSSAIQYADGAYYSVPYWFTGAKSGAGYKGQLKLMYKNGDKTGSYSSAQGKTVVTITVDKASGEQVLTVNHQGSSTTFFKGTAFQKGVLPKL